MAPETRLLLIGTLGVLGACGDAGYDLYEAEPPPAEGSSTGGASGDGDALTPDRMTCEAQRDPSLSLVRLTPTASDECLTQGSAILLMDNPGFSITLAECNEEVAQFWTLVGLADGAWELRNEGSGMNLDMRYAATDDGTQAVLYEAHQFQNQRFYISPAPGNSFRLSPKNADEKCLERRGSSLELWPCDTTEPAQLFEQRPCANDEL